MGGFERAQPSTREVVEMAHGLRAQEVETLERELAELPRWRVRRRSQLRRSLRSVGAVERELSDALDAMSEQTQATTEPVAAAPAPRARRNVAYGPPVPPA
jgi:hypothetical protein